MIDTRFFRENRKFWLALALSLLVHALILALSPKPSSKSVAATRHLADKPRLDVALQPSPVADPEVIVPPAQKPPRPRERRPPILTAKPDLSGAVRVPTWSVEEREAMDGFLNELTPDAGQRSGRELARRAMAMAGRMRQPVEQDNELLEMRQKFANAQTDPYSIELYFDALFRKMNRSAAMVPIEKRSGGRQVAAVRVVVDQRGAVKSFRVLWAADQQAEVDYIRRVIDMAAPFPVFPDDIRAATDSIVLQICIQPGGEGSSGAAFSRMAAGQSCQPR